MTAPRQAQGKGPRGPRPLRRYEVTIIAWSIHESVIEATNAERAKIIAEERWKTAKYSFVHRNEGIESTTVRLLSREEGR